MALWWNNKLISNIQHKEINIPQYYNHSCNLVILHALKDAANGSLLQQYLQQEDTFQVRKSIS